MQVNNVLTRLEGVKSRGQDKYQSKCPAHDDNRASLSIEKTQDKILFYCHAGCGYADILEAIGLTASDLFKDNDTNYGVNVKQPRNRIEKVYEYTDEEGNIIHEKVRFTGKGFANRHIDKDDSVIWGLDKGIYYETFQGSNNYSRKKKEGAKTKEVKAVTPVIYNLPKVVQAIKETETIYIVEGEKDADLLNEKGFVATTNYEGAGKGKFKKQYAKYFTGADVVVIQDSDKAGEEAAETIANILFDVVNNIKVVDLGDYSKAKGFDVTDYFDMGYTKEEFIEMIEGNPFLDKKITPTGESEGKGESLNDFVNNNYTTNNDDMSIVDWYDYNEKTGKHKLIPGKLAEYLAENIPALYTTGRFYLYKNGVYKVCNYDEEKTVIMDHIITSLRRIRDINDIATQWSINSKVRISPEEINKDPYILNLQNGLYDIRTKELKEHDKNFISTIQLNTKYDPSTGTGEVFNKFINEVVPDKDNLLLVQEMLGYAITSFNNAKKVFLLTGKGDSGKSTYLNIIEDLLGKENISNVMLQKLSDRFNVAQLYGKVANIFADLPSEPLRENSTFKALTGGDKVQGERKGKDPFEFYNKAKLIFSCNDLPANYGDRSDAFYNRLIMIPFNNSIPKERQDPFLRDKLKKELDYIFIWAMEGLERLVNNNFVFTENEATKELVENYKLNSNNAFQFLNECCEVDINHRIAKIELYDYYKEYCNQYGFKNLNFNNFYQEVLKYDPRIQDKGLRTKNSRARAINGINFIG